MNADDRFAKAIDYIFFSQYLSELRQVIDKTQILIRMSSAKTKQGTKVTANVLHNPEILKEMFKSDEALRFLQPIRGTPSFWQLQKGFVCNVKAARYTDLDLLIFFG